MTNSPVAAPVLPAVPGVVSVGAAIVVPPVSNITRVLDESLMNRSEWYLGRERDLVDVTDEESNMVFGIKHIGVRPATIKQQEFYTIANITLDTVLGRITGIQVRESKKKAGEIYLSASSHNIAKADETARWMSDVDLDRAVQAQILSHVHGMLVPVPVPVK